MQLDASKMQKKRAKIQKKKGKKANFQINSLINHNIAYLHYTYIHAYIHTYSDGPLIPGQNPLGADSPLNFFLWSPWNRNFFAVSPSKIYINKSQPPLLKDHCKKKCGLNGAGAHGQGAAYFGYSSFTKKGCFHFDNLSFFWHLLDQPHCFTRFLLLPTVKVSIWETLHWAKRP